MDYDKLFKNLGDFNLNLSQNALKFLVTVGFNCNQDLYMVTKEIEKREIENKKK